MYLSALIVGVPSRLYFQKIAHKSYSGLRIGIKDIIDLNGLRTSASSRGYTELHDPKEKSAPAVQILLKQGLKKTQFADSVANLCYVDYHAPFNPRANGYQSPSFSSSGPASAAATYPWLHFTIGTDAHGSIRSPASSQNIVGTRSCTASFDGIIPYSSKFDTIGGFARTFEEFYDLANALY